MEVVTTGLEGLLVLRPRLFGDDRGFFLESFNEQRFKALTGADVRFVQDNESSSRAGVLRGLHFQADPHAQGKLVHVGRGSVLDVAVDLRHGSPTQGRHFSIHLNAAKREMLWIPAGFAHGFVALEDDTLFLYKCTNYYQPAAERTIRWNDPELAIDWGITDPLVSPKDADGMSYRTYLGTAGTR
ncbi:MAG: dTDP-4-dehydrorhamnose 3,5-epimerase [Flavobacteriales bacterium]|nr:dTDP-4-dehydrorhamnose 3,5-epimerase [Flavobacteriales bacterium]